MNKAYDCKDRDEFFDTLKTGGVDGVLKKYRTVEEVIEDANKLWDDMATALEALHAEQNGAPLIRDAAKWEAVMKTVEDVLTRYHERGK
jgi:hypothetical protein